MSKFLVHSKTFLPMVIQKSSTETTQQIFENHPSLSSKPLLTAGTQTDSNKKDDVLPNEEMKKMPLQETMVVSKVATVNRETQRTVFQALIMDVVQVQEVVMIVLARWHMWLLGRPLGLMRGLTVSGERGPRGMGRGDTTLVWIEGRPKLKEDEPIPLILPERLGKKMSPMIAKSDKGEGKERPDEESKISLKSNVWETVMERSPGWQKSISNGLGELQKKVVQKFST
ncbi:uncharacterized protein LOC124358717 isoform X1 [Homalodisca vitripennis]|uniref:uncharacterized protein LOC124358717 isoform X1 n=1 Tax=Homalodisca vitripennis TaxID=197043 RepID=UPI001EEBA1FB|nr:uncharacterized protein LOC124358717 isoform X1 [Homalodisca vitripennis]